MKKNRILYLHGFNSSPKSLKSELTQDYVQQNLPAVDFVCPWLKTSPNKVIEQVEAILSESENTQWHLMGSSLGGYFSTYLAEKYQLKAVLINPAVRPFELLRDYLGQQENPYSGEVYQVTEQHMQELSALYCEKISKNRYMVMVQTGDEVLDYQQAVDKYQGGHVIVQQGGDHSFIHYQDMLPEIMQFLELAN